MRWNINRRNFGKVAGAAALATLAPSKLFSFAAKPTGNLRIAAVGLRGRGRDLIKAVALANNAELAALADVDAQVLQSTENTNRTLLRTDDFRRLLDRKDIDAVVCATPNHWHALVTILACQAGKHVYIEKPVSHNMAESRAVVAAASRFNRVVQAGFQNRSDSGLRDFFSRLHKNEFGTVRSVHGLCHRKRDSIGRLPAELAVPPHLNFDLWLGPAAKKSIMRPNLHYDWHWDFDTGNGDVGNQGPHEWDLINWALGDPIDLPQRMIAAGNRFGWNDAGNTPNVMACVGESGGIPIYFEVMNLNPGGVSRDGCDVGVIIETEQGKFVGGRGGGRFEWSDGRREKFSRNEAQADQDGTPSHLQNFVDAAIAGDASTLRSPCRVAANSSSLPHMANISYQLGQAGSSADIEAAFSDSAIGRDLLGRLRKSTKIYSANKDHQKIEPWILGTALRYEHGQYQFTGTNAENANASMKREYRSGFELPAI